MQIHDNANIFSKDAVQQADREIKQIKERHRHELLIETYPKIPDDLQNDFKTKSKDQFYDDWAVPDDGRER